jgi:hypothetical protein
MKISKGSIRREILEKREATWRLKSRSLWLERVDKNSIFLHQ